MRKNIPIVTYTVHKTAYQMIKQYIVYIFVLFCIYTDQKAHAWKKYYDQRVHKMKHIGSLTPTKQTLGEALETYKNNVFKHIDKFPTTHHGAHVLNAGTLFECVIEVVAEPYILATPESMQTTSVPLEKIGHGVCNVKKIICSFKHPIISFCLGFRLTDKPLWVHYILTHQEEQHTYTFPPLTKADATDHNIENKTLYSSVALNFFHPSGKPFSSLTIVCETEKD